MNVKEVSRTGTIAGTFATAVSSPHGWPVAKRPYSAILQRPEDSPKVMAVGTSEPRTITPEERTTAGTLLARARNAMRAVEGYDQAAVDRVCRAIAWAGGNEATATQLANMSVDESGMGSRKLKRRAKVQRLRLRRFVRSYGLESLLNDPRFATNEARVQHASDLDDAICEAIQSRTLAENVEIIDANHLTAVPVQTVADIERDPHWRARQLTLDVPGAAGPARMHDVFPRLSETPGEIRWSGGALGQDNFTVFGELGLTPADLENLLASGII